MFIVFRLDHGPTTAGKAVSHFFFFWGFVCFYLVGVLRYFQSTGKDNGGTGGDVVVDGLVLLGRETAREGERELIEEGNCVLTLWVFFFLSAVWMGECAQGREEREREG